MKKSLFILIASLFLGGSIYAQTSHYPNHDPEYDQHSDIWAFIQIDGEYITYSDNYEDYEVGAFVNGVCQGHAFLTDYSETYPVTDMLPIFYPSGNTSGELTFKLYDHANGWEYTQCTTSMTIVIGHDYFGIDEDIPVFSFTTPSYTLDITGYGDNTAPSNYYLIASPVGTVNVADVSHMADNDFDLYYFDQAQEDEWINYEQGAFSLDPGTGYLYASKNDVQLVFKGFYTGDGKVTLKKDLNGTNVGQGFEGWNLVGNPYATEATIDRSFYKMNGDATGGTGLLATAQTGSIDPMMGIFVLATANGEEMTFTPATSKASSNMVNVELSKENGSIMDRVIVRFGDGDLLPKIQLFEGTSKIYVPQSDGDYAILNASNDGQMPVNFKAAENGNYTLVVTPENVEMEYLHLIDNLTGADVDLLTNPKYNFSANTTDYFSRFTLRFRANSSVDVNEMFCPMTYRQDGTLAINGIQGESELTIIDMLGRVVSKEAFNITDGMIRNIVATPGVYVLRLMNNNNVYTQKIVVE